MLTGRHSAYNHWNIGDNIKAGSVCSTAIGVSGDDGGVSKDVACDSSGLRARYGDSGGRPRTDCRCSSIGLSRKSLKLKIFLQLPAMPPPPPSEADVLAFKFESDVDNVEFRISSVSSALFIEADRQLNELDKLLAILVGNWNISNDGDSNKFGDKRYCVILELSDECPVALMDLENFVDFVEGSGGGFCIVEHCSSSSPPSQLMVGGAIIEILI